MNKKLLYFLLVIGLAVVGMWIGGYYMSPEERVEAQKVEPIPCPAEGKISIISVYDNYYINPNLTTSVVRPTLLYIWRSSPKYAPPERSR